MKRTSPETGGYIIAAALLVVVSVLLFIVVMLWLRPPAIPLHCNDFGSRAEILDSFHAGNRGLDGDGDGIPCENRK